MKVAAHPILVAVALGLLAPGALEETFEDTQARTATAEHRSVPSAEEQAYAERLWHEVSLEIEEA